MTRVLVLGGGFGGIAVAVGVKQGLGADADVTLVDRKPAFSMGLRKLWELVGIGTIAEGSRPRTLLERRGVRVLQAEIESIDPAARSAVVAGERLEADTLVVALGAEPRPDLVPGLAEHGHDVWNPAGVPALRERLLGLEQGQLVVAIAGVPYTCPPAPFELTFLVDEWLRERGVRDGVELELTTPQPILMPNAGKEGSRWVGEQLASRGVRARAGMKIERVEPGEVVYAEERLPFDVLVGVPPHRPPRVVADSGLAAESGWVGVDRGTLETSFPGVFAVGDVTQIPLASGLQLPKAGVMAEAQGARVAAAIVAEARGEGEPPPFDGHGFCFLETGASTAALVDGEFFHEPDPVVVVRPPTADAAAAKHAFEAERHERWFGA